MKNKQKWVILDLEDGLFYWVDNAKSSQEAINIYVKDMFCNESLL